MDGGTLAKPVNGSAKSLDLSDHARAELFMAESRGRSDRAHTTDPDSLFPRSVIVTEHQDRCLFSVTPVSIERITKTS